LSKIVIEPQDIQMNFGMDNSKFKNDIGWTPLYDMPDIINSLFQYLSKGHQQ